MARTRLGLGTAPLLRLRSDEQLVTLFRSGSEDAFRVIHDRYRTRMFAYSRQMLAGSAADAEDAVQEIFVRAYAGLRASDRELALRAWLYRVAHNRCVDELRRPQMAPAEELPDTAAGACADPVAECERRDALRRLIADVQRLPEQQRSALLMRELGGMTYADVAAALGVSVPAVKSLLVRARVGLAQANEARDTACARIREDLIVAHDRGVRASGLARRHLRDCPSCRQFRTEVRGVSRQLAAFAPALGPLGVAAKLLGIGGAGAGGGTAAAGSGAMAGGTAGAAGATAATGLAGAGAVAGAGALAGTGHVVTLLAAAVITAGGAIELPHMAPPVILQARHHHHVVRPAPAVYPHSAVSGSAAVAIATTPSTPGTTAADIDAAQADNPAQPGSAVSAPARPGHSTAALMLSETVDPDHLGYQPANATGTPASGASTATSGTTTGTGSSCPSPSSATTPATTCNSTSSASPTQSGSTGTGTSSSTGSSSTSSGTTSGSTSTSTGAANGSGGSSSSTSGTPVASSASAGSKSTSTQTRGSDSGTPAASTVTAS